VIFAPTNPSRSTRALRAGASRLLGALAVAVGLVGALASPALAQRGLAGESDFKSSMNPPVPEALKGLDVTERLGEKVPLDLEFTDSTGRRVKLGEYFNQSHKPVLLTMVYYRCPMQCQLILNRLNKRFNQLDLTIGEKFNVVAVSFDPGEGQEAAAKQKVLALSGYDRPHPPSLEAGWGFLTGPGANSRALANALGFPYRYLPESNEFAHPTVSFVLTPDGTISRYLYGIDYPVERLRMALMEASDGKIGNSWDRLVLWCFHFDPTKGEYVLTAFRVMQIATIASALGLFGLLGTMWVVVERRRRSWQSFAHHTPGPVSPGGLN
jgi:protein SCO1/2